MIPAKPTPGDTAHGFEHYELVKSEDGMPIELRRGAMGVTYKAFDVDLRCTVTLKVISEKYIGDASARLRFARSPLGPAFVTRTSPPYFTLGKSEAVTSTRIRRRRDTGEVHQTLGPP